MKNEIIRGTLWNSAATYLSLIVRLLGTIIIARMFTPEDFGIVTYIISVYALGSMFLGWGAPSFIVKTTTKISEAIKATRIVQNSLFIAIGLLFIALYPLLFGQGGLHFLIFLAVVLGRTINNLGAPYVGYLTKQMEFKKFALMIIISDVLSIGISILAAFLGAGIWAVVLLLVLPDAVIGALQMLFVKLPRFTKKVGKQHYKDIYHYGKYNVLSNIFDKTYRQTDDITVKNFLGVAALGIYNQAYKLSELFSNMTFGAIGVTAGAVFGKLQDDRKLLSRNFHTFSAVVTRVILMLYTPFFLLATQAILFVYGEQWTSMAVIVQALSIYAILAPIRRIARLLHTNIGQSKPIAVSQWYELIAFLVVLFPGVYFFDLLGAAMAVNVGIIVGLGILIHKTRKVIDVHFTKILLPPLLSAVFTSIIFTLITSYIQFSSPFIQLAISSILIVIIYSVLLLVMERKELVKLLKQVLKKKDS